MSPRYFKQNVSSRWSTVKISDEVPRNSTATIDTVVYTSQLEDVFKQNFIEDRYLRYDVVFSQGLPDIPAPDP